MTDLSSSENHAHHSPLVSVVIPCYNVERFVADALNSLVSQTYSNLEIICVDDGSSDHTLELLLKWEEENPNFHLQVVKQSNKGACAARNNGLEMAKGAYVQFLDADDVLFPEKIEHQVKILEKYRNVGFVAGAYRNLSVSGDSTKHIVSSNSFLTVFYGKAGITSSNLFRKSAVDAVGGWNEAISSSQEADLMFRVMLNGFEFIADQTILTEIRERHSGQISQDNPVKRLKNYLFVRTAMVDKIQQNLPEEWEKNKSYYLSFIVSTLILLERYERKAWKEYDQYLPKKALLRPIAGLTPKIISAIRLLGYRLFFILNGYLRADRI